MDVASAVSGHRVRHRASSFSTTCSADPGPAAGARESSTGRPLAPVQPYPGLRSAPPVVETRRVVRCIGCAGNPAPRMLSRAGSIARRPAPTRSTETSHGALVAAPWLVDRTDLSDLLR